MSKSANKLLTPIERSKSTLLLLLGTIVTVAVTVTVTMMLVVMMVMMMAVPLIARMLNSLDEPGLIISSMKIPLDDCCSFLHFAIGNVKSFVSSVSLDDVSFVGPFSISNSADFEPTARMFSMINNWLSVVVFAILMDGKQIFVMGSNKKEFPIFSM